jgi:hypothetical protein
MKLCNRRLSYVNRAGIWTRVSLLSLSALAVADVAAGVAASHHSFGELPTAVPGVIEAERFDRGPEGAAYHDTDRNDTGDTRGGFRQTGVDIGFRPGKPGGRNGGYCVTDIRAGEWLAYTVSTEKAGAYDLDLHLVSTGKTGRVRVLCDGIDVTGPIDLPKPDEKASWQTVSRPNVQLPVGRHVLRVEFAIEANAPGDIPANGVLEIGRFDRFTLRRAGEREEPLDRYVRPPTNYRRPHGLSVDLLSLIRRAPRLHGAPGVWTLRDGALVADRRGSDSLVIPYEPPTEYDFIAEFTRTAGAESVSQLLTHDGREFEWITGGWGNTVMGFHNVAGWGANVNPTGTLVAVENNRRYTSVVRVRDGGVSAYLDGKLVAEWETDYADLGRFFARANPRWLGLRTHESEVVFHRLEVVRADMDPAVVWQVLPAAQRPEAAKLMSAVHDALPELDAIDFPRREAATALLRQMGPDVVSYLMQLDPADLTEEQRRRVAALIHGHRRLSAKEAAALRRDPWFLLDCLDAESTAVRSAAVIALGQLAGRPISMDPLAPQSLRRQWIASVRLSLLAVADADEWVRRFIRVDWNFLDVGNQR